MPLEITYPLSALLAIVIPILAGALLAQKYGLTWKLFLYGAAAFILAQLAQVPLNFILIKLFPALHLDQNALVQALAFSLTAAITEEPARYSVLKGKLSWARGWREALMFGAGHGGLPSIFAGVSMLGAYISMSSLRANLAQLSQIPPEQQALMQQQLDQYWSLTWSLSLMPAVDRFVALFVHISLAVLVMQVFLRGDRRWLWIAMGWHGVAGFLSAWSLSYFKDPLIITALLGVLLLTSLIIILFFRPAPPDLETT